MEHNPVIFDISSDEEPVLGGHEDDDGDWLSRVLGAVDSQMLTGDSDDVVFVGEVNPRKKLASAVRNGGGFSDDCVVLEEDPDRTSELPSDSKEDSDDCLVIGEKGQVACRDFPHPRHDCALFPFSSTPHEGHCELCHCFVCDKRAPCAFWGLGTSSSDHCHANDKNDTWNLLRKNFRLGIKAPLQASKGSNPSPAATMPQLNQAQHSRITQLLSTCAPLQQVTRPVSAHSGNRLPPNQLRSTVRGCLSSTRQRVSTREGVSTRERVSTGQGVLGITSQVRTRSPGSVWNKNPVQHQLMQQQSMPQQFVGVRNTVVWKVRARNGTGSPFVPSSTVSKRIDARVLPAVKQSTNILSNSTADNASKPTQNAIPATAPYDRYYTELMGLISGENPGTCIPQSSPRPNAATAFSGSVPSQPLVASVPVAQPDTVKHTSLSETECFPGSVQDLGDLNYSWVNGILQNVPDPVDSTSQPQNIESTSNELLASEGNQASNSTFDEFDFPVFDFEQHVPIGVPGDVCMSPDLWSFDSDVFFF